MVYLLFSVGSCAPENPVLVVYTAALRQKHFMGLPDKHTSLFLRFFSLICFELSPQEAAKPLF